jgi:hypothetical protein
MKDGAQRTMSEEIDFGVIVFEVVEDYEKICKILNIEPDLIVDPVLKTCYYDVNDDTVVIGVGDDFWWCRTCRRRNLVHEMLHASGLEHNTQSRSFGFYSFQERDTFTIKILGWIFSKPLEVLIHHFEKHVCR